MPEPLDDPRIAEALRDQLLAMPVPPASPGFNARVIQQVAARPGRIAGGWHAMRHFIAGAACSSAATAALLYVALAVPTAAPGALAVNRPPDRAAIERMLRNAGLQPGELDMDIAGAPLPQDPVRRQRTGPRPDRSALPGPRVAALSMPSCWRNRTSG